MKKIERTAMPDCLKENYKRWGSDYEHGCKNFSWHGRRDNIIEVLVQMTSNHCSFCDGYPAVDRSDTIEHFYPKHVYPFLAYCWYNLFLCCSGCQRSKGQKFNKKLLKPDRVGYEFNRYFVFNYTNYKIEVNPFASDDDQERARITIEMYGLNHTGLKKSRQIQHRSFEKDKFNIDDVPYRFMYECF